MTFRSVKMKKRDYSDYTLAGVGVGVGPALTIPKISGGAMSYYSTKWGPPTSAVNSGPSVPIPTADRKTVELANQLHHNLAGLHKKEDAKSMPIKNEGKKRKNYMGIFEKGHREKKK
jgi:hypothetical protein